MRNTTLVLALATFLLLLFTVYPPKTSSTSALDAWHPAAPPPPAAPSSQHSVERPDLTFDVDSTSEDATTAEEELLQDSLLPVDDVELPQDATEEEQDDEAQTVVEEIDEDRIAVVTMTPDERPKAEEPEEAEPVLSVEEQRTCTADMKARVSRANFWIIRGALIAFERRPVLTPERTEPSPGTYTVSSRLADSSVPLPCLANAIFAARLVRGSARDDTETIVPLPRPSYIPDSTSYAVSISPHLVFPQGSYRVEARLEFGSFPTPMGQPCGEEAVSCDPVDLWEDLGSHIEYIGVGLEHEERKKNRVQVGDGELEQFQLLLPSADGVIADAIASDPSLCSTLSPLDGYWDRLVFHPTPLGEPCSLVEPSQPLPTLTDSTAEQAPLWLNFIGDSNTRNGFSLLAKMLGDGPYANAKVVDSPEHNGTVATIALRSRSGDQPYDNGASLPDLILTWSWWYQLAPPLANATADEWQATLTSNRNSLMSIADTTLSSYASKFHLLSTVGSSSSPLGRLARTLRPHRTFLSLGSHGEELTTFGMHQSLDYLFSEDGGLSTALRQSLNLRLLTVTLVNSAYIPLERFPHQDLVRNNVLIEQRNLLTRERPELGGEGRVVDMEGLTRGVTEGWMKSGRHGMDAVHFREEVYQTWARVILTELATGDVKDSSEEVEVVSEKAVALSVDEEEDDDDEVEAQESILREEDDDLDQDEVLA